MTPRRRGGRGDGMLVTVRRGKTNPEGETKDVRNVADALRTLRAAASPGPEDRVVPLSPQMVGLRFQASARAAGVEARVTAHSARVGLASARAARGASTTDVMLAGNWKTSRMVAHYSSGGRRPSAGRWRSTSETQPGARRPPPPSPTSVHRLAVVAVVSVGFVGERLDDADVEGQGSERGRANCIAEGGRGRPRPPRVGWSWSGSNIGEHLSLFVFTWSGGRGARVLRAGRASVVTEVAGGVVGRAEELSLSERRIDLGGRREPEPAAVVDLDQEEASARSCAHAPSALSHPFGRGRVAGPSSPAPPDDNTRPRA